MQDVSGLSCPGVSLMSAAASAVLAAPEGKQAIGRVSAALLPNSSDTRSQHSDCGLNTSYTTEISEGSKLKSDPGPSLCCKLQKFPLGQVFSATRFGSVLLKHSQWGVME